MRLLTGYCFAGAFIVAESWLNGSASNETRGQLVSQVTVVQMGGWRPASSLNLADPRGFDLFILVSVLISVAAVPMLLTAAAAPTVATPRDIGLLGLYWISPLGVVGIAGIGVAHSGLYSMGPVFASEVGLSVAAISTFMACVILGGVLFQVPIGRVSGRARPPLGDRRGGAAAAVAALPPVLFAHLPTYTLFPGFFLVGGLAADLRAVRGAHQRLPGTRADGGRQQRLILAYGIGAAGGPTLTALAMQALGPRVFLCPS